MIYFSATTLGFYPQNSQADYLVVGSWPDDAVMMTEKEQATYWKQSLPAGQMLGAVKGRPAWVSLPQPMPPTADKLASTARYYRDAFIIATDPMMVSDYSIDDVPLTEAQRSELIATRAAYRSWTTLANWPLIELPELPQWLLIEAVNQGYRVPVWPEQPNVA
ncbi:TPA: phage tail protein [Yersinia enterocolitica]|nr:phage tail protein [Yersinia enterocolitica]